MNTNTNTNTSTNTNPAWWKPEYDSAWDRTKEALRRDWEQTKHDMGSKTAKELGQDAGDTVKQAAGTSPIPHHTARTFDEDSAAARYGVGARQHFGKGTAPWSTDVETELRKSWKGDDWETARGGVRRGWEYQGK